MESRDEQSELHRKSARVPPRISPLRWLVWWVSLFISLIVFYGFFSIFWFVLRAAAWMAELRSRRRRARFAGESL